MSPLQYGQDYLTRAETIIAALDSPVRIQILLRLRRRGHMVHELVTNLRKSQPLISQHLRVLKQAGIVDSTRPGREVCYALILPGVIDILDQATRLTLSEPASEATGETGQRSALRPHRRRTTGSYGEFSVARTAAIITSP